MLDPSSVNVCATEFESVIWSVPLVGIDPGIVNDAEAVWPKAIKFALVPYVTELSELFVMPTSLENSVAPDADVPVPIIAATVLYSILLVPPVLGERV
jgi:hypothetical protein